MGNVRYHNFACLGEFSYLLVFEIHIEETKVVYIYIWMLYIGYSSGIIWLDAFEDL